MQRRRRVDPALLGQPAGGGLAVLDVGDAPGVAQQVAVGAAEAGGAAVVHVDDGEAPRRPVLDAQPQARAWRRGRTTVDHHEQRRALPVRPAKPGWSAGRRGRTRWRRRPVGKSIDSGTEISPAGRPRSRGVESTSIGREAHRSGPTSTATTAGSVLGEAPTHEGRRPPGHDRLDGRVRHVELRDRPIGARGRRGGRTRRGCRRTRPGHRAGSRSATRRTPTAAHRSRPP